MPHTPPKYKKEQFHCPHCGVFAQQRWVPFHHPRSAAEKSPDISREVSKSEHLPGYRYAQCLSCQRISIWEDEKIIHPSFGISPQPNPDMPLEVKKIFEEAGKISSISPRASAGLLRLCIEKITEELEENDDLNARIANLVKGGLPIEIQQALDVVRVTGNDALHVGQIDLNGSPETTRSLFDIVNIIVQRMISDKKQIKSLYEQLPKEKRNGIENRDKNSHT